MTYRSLDADRIVETAEKLRSRIAERFAQSGLRKVAEELVQVTREAAQRAAWIEKPFMPLRFVTGGVIALIVALGVSSFFAFDLQVRFNTLGEFAQTLESLMNDIVLIAAAIFFLISFEQRIKRTRALKALHELRSLAHIIDMHQLPKDPEVVRRPGADTPSSPKRNLSPFELARYLDYCTEMLAVLSKVAALYGQKLHDHAAITAVDDFESLCTGLSRKIWQKISAIKES